MAKTKRSRPGPSTQSGVTPAPASAEPTTPFRAPGFRQISWWTWGAVAVVAAAFVLRLVDLDGKSLWFDEALSIDDSLSLTRRFGSGFHPPLYYLFLHAWMTVAGDSPPILRLPSAVAGAATIAAVFLAGRRTFGEKAGLVAASLLAIASLHIEYSQEVRMYAFETLWLACAAWTLAEALSLDRDDRRAGWLWAAAFTVSAWLALGTHYLAAVYLGFQGLVLLACLRQTRPVVVRLALLQAPALAVLGVVAIALNYGRQIYVAYSLASTTKGVNASLFANPGARAAALPLELTTNLLPGFALKWLAVASYRLPAIVAFDLVAVAAIVLAARRHDTPLAKRLAVLAPALAPLPLLAMMVGPEQLRFYLAAAPFLAIAIGGGLSLVRPKALLAALLAVLLVPSALATWWYFDPGMDKQPWRKTSQMVASQARPGDLVLVTESHLLLSFSRYFPPTAGVETVGFPELGGVTITRENIPLYLDPLLRNHPRVWYIRGLATARQSDPEALALKTLDARYHLVSRLIERGYNGDIEIFLFEG